MKTCTYCGSASKISPCEKCGKGLFYFESGALFCSQNAEKGRNGCEIVLTDKYLILRRGSFGNDMMNGMSMTGGLLGGLLFGALSAKKEKSMPHGYYDLKEIEKVIYPYVNNKLKPDVALKIINKDSTDLVISINKRLTKMLADAMAGTGIPVTDGSNEQNGDVYCYKPFVTLDNISLRVCASAGSFVTLNKDQFIAAPIVKG